MLLEVFHVLDAVRHVLWVVGEVFAAFGDGAAGVVDMEGVGISAFAHVVAVCVVYPFYAEI